MLNHKNISLFLLVWGSFQDCWYNSFFIYFGFLIVKKIIVSGVTLPQCRNQNFIFDFNKAMRNRWQVFFIEPMYQTSSFWNIGQNKNKKTFKSLFKSLIWADLSVFFFTKLIACLARQVRNKVLYFFFLFERKSWSNSLEYKIHTLFSLRKISQYINNQIYCLHVRLERICT